MVKEGLIKSRMGGSLGHGRAWTKRGVETELVGAVGPLIGPGQLPCQALSRREDIRYSGCIVARRRIKIAIDLCQGCQGRRSWMKLWSIPSHGHNCTVRLQLRIRLRERGTCPGWRPPSRCNATVMRWEKAPSYCLMGDKVRHDFGHRRELYEGIIRSNGTSGGGRK